MMMTLRSFCHVFSFYFFMFLIPMLLASEDTESSLRIISRKEWGAKPAKEEQQIAEKLSFAIVHHSVTPFCNTTERCMRRIRSIQEYHQSNQNWSDIGYSFLIGGDGNIYEGRGFNVVGAHAPGYNSNSVGICFIGTYTNSLPTKAMLDVAQKLIQHGLSEGHLKPDYKVFGHRQVTNTECPGKALFEEIQKWPHFSNEV